MSWEIFRCNTDCEKDPANCISERLYHEQADAIVAQGFLTAGYNAIHMDDCWERKVPPRDPATSKLVGDPVRFPSGMKALGDYYHGKGVKYALVSSKALPVCCAPTRIVSKTVPFLAVCQYTAESTRTCGGYPASADHEVLDAKTFAEWGVDYMKVNSLLHRTATQTNRACAASLFKSPSTVQRGCFLSLNCAFSTTQHQWHQRIQVDGCGPSSYYDHGYKAMGAALEASGRPIEYSCSWPAYINGGNESIQPFTTFIEYGCNGWRNWHDIQCSSGSLMSIVDHWGDYGLALQPFAGPGHWHDMDMLLIGNGCISHAEEMTQMAIVSPH
eukprot:SAG22_NODE_1173_length_5253_cov_4.401436_3_plen_329_part_00